MVCCWRDFSGTIPQDAVPVGTENDQPYFISQGLITSFSGDNGVCYGVLPAKIMHMQTTIYPCIGEDLPVSDGIKVSVTIIY